MENLDKQVEFLPTESHKSLLIEVSKAIEVKDFTIESAEQYELAGKQGVAIATLRKRLEDTRKEAKQPFLDAGRDVDAYFKAELTKLDSAKRTIGAEISRWDREQERLRKEREAEARLLAEEQACKDRLAAEAEALEAAENDDEQAFEQAVAEIEAPIAPVVPIVREEKVKVKNVNKRITYTAEVDDLHAFLKAATDNVMMQAVISVDLKKLARLAKDMDGKLDWPGINIHSKEVTQFRSKSQ